ncbi:MAG TPA: hypothetical protein VFL27_10950 [Candidatus Dormibacteraeota bacterium]|nr:hypothetical protein [Candidatus Dormibacteraeota bacterium]
MTGEVGKDNDIMVDWPRSIGFFGALGVAAALELVPIPIAIFVAAVPFLKLLDDPRSSTPRRFFTHLVDGAAKPVGGDSEGTVRWAGGRRPAKRTPGRARGGRR